MSEQLKRKLLAYKKSTDKDRLKPGKTIDKRYEDGNVKKWTPDNHEVNSGETYLSKTAYGYKPSDVLTPDNHITIEEIEWQKNHPHTTESYEKRIEKLHADYEAGINPPVFDKDDAGTHGYPYNLRERVEAAVDELASTTEYHDATGENTWFSNKLRESLAYILTFSGVNATVTGKISTDYITWTDIQSGDDIEVDTWVRLTPTPVTSLVATEFKQWVGAGNLPSESTDPTTKVLEFKMPKRAVELTASYAISAEFILFQGGSDFTSLGFSSTDGTLQYYDGSGWVTTGNTITVTDGYVPVRGKDLKIYGFTGNFTSVSGNLMYLVNYEASSTPDLAEDQFYSSSKGTGLFEGCSRLTDVSALTLPFTTLGKRCYSNMFKNCGALSKMFLSLPATTLVEACYENMFYGCSALKTAPSLSTVATTALNSCKCMFAYSTALTVAPSFSDSCVEIAQSACEGMFLDCEALTTALSFSHITTLNASSCKYMFESCKALKTAPDLSSITSLKDDGAGYYANCETMFKDSGIATDASTPAPWFSSSVTNLPAYSCNAMFQGCTSLMAAPDMSAVGGIDNYACQYMFEGCSSLFSAATCNATSVGEYGCAHMYENCVYMSSAEGAFKFIGVSKYGCYEMFNGCKNLKVAPDMSTITTFSGTNPCLTEMFYGCSALCGPVYLPQVKLTRSANTYNMFSGAGTSHKSSASGETAVMYYTDGYGGWNSDNAAISSSNWSVKKSS